MKAFSHYYQMRHPTCTLLLLLALLATACSQSTLAPTATPSPTPQPTPTSTPTLEPTPEPTWQLIWQDEFDGVSIDESKWSFEVNGRGGGNNELQYYTDNPDNAFIEDGMLVIQALKPEKRYIGKEYTSARIRSLGKGDWTYGRFEIRAKLPYWSKGFGPLVWMLPTDMAAMVAGLPVVRSTSWNWLDMTQTLFMVRLHYGESWQSPLYTGKPYSLAEGDFSEDFHEFALGVGRGRNSLVC